MREKGVGYFTYHEGKFLTQREPTDAHTDTQRIQLQRPNPSWIVGLSGPIIRGISKYL